MQKTEAILLRRQEVRETSLLLTGFSRELGKFQGLLKGVRGARAAVPWYPEPLTLQAVVLYERRRSPWALVSHCDLLEPFEPLRRDLTRLAYATYLLDLVDGMTGLRDPHPEIYDLLHAGLRGLERAPTDPGSLARCVEAHLLKQCGFLPSIETLAASAQTKAELRKILVSAPTQVANLHLSPLVNAELRRLHEALIRRALERDLRTRGFLHAIGLDTTNAPVVSSPNTHVISSHGVARDLAPKDGISRPPASK